MMRFFPKKTMLILGLLAAVTTVGVHSATAGGSATVQQSARPAADQEAAKGEVRGDKMIRVVGPAFFPDNGDIKLLGAAKERGQRG